MDKGLVVLAVLVLLAVIVWSIDVGIFLGKYTVGAYSPCVESSYAQCPDYYCELKKDWND